MDKQIFFLDLSILEYVWFGNGEKALSREFA